MSKRLLTTVTAMLLSLFSCLNLWADTSGEIIAQGGTRNIRWILTDDGTLTLDGTGQMTDYGQTSVDAPWMKYNEYIRKVVMNGNITNVSRMAFNECSYLEDVVLPSTIKSIDDYAFNNCSSLKEFTFPAALETIGSRAFYGCKIENLELPDGLKTLGSEAFTGNSFSELYIPKSVTYINERCFDNTDKLGSIEVDEDNTVYTSKDKNGNNCEAIIKKSTSDTDDVTLIQGCRNTVIGNNVTVIGAYAFYKQQYLSEARIPNSVKEIKEHAFEECKNLRLLEIGEGLQYIEQGAFYDCPLESVTIAATPPTCGENAFGPTDMTANATLYVPSYAIASQYWDNEVWSKAFPTIKTSEKRLYAELDRDNWALKFHYDDKTDFADGIAILDNLRFNFSSRDVESLLNEYVTLDPTVENDDARYYIKEIDFDPSFRNYKPTSCYHQFSYFIGCPVLRPNFKSLF